MRRRDFEEPQPKNSSWGLREPYLRRMRRVFDVQKWSPLQFLFEHAAPGEEVSFWRDDAGRWFVDVDGVRGDGANPEEAARNAVAVLIAR